MPGGDRTGPLGAGPRTGRGQGRCNGYKRSGFGNPAGAFRGGYGFRNRGAGRGWRNRFYATGTPAWVAPTPDDETVDLKAQADWLKAQLDIIQKRLDELKSE